MKNYYEILEVDVKASKEMIDRAFKLLAKRYHPDTKSDEKKEWAEEKFKEINEAYEILSNEENRKKYDIELDYEKNSAIQALCAKNEHLQQQVQRLEKELEFFRNSTTNNNYFASNASSHTNTNNQSNNDNIVQNYIRYAQNMYENNAYKDYIKPVTEEELYSYKKSRVKDFFAFLITIAIIIGIGFLLWNIPFTRNFLIGLYEDNPPIKGLVDFFLNLFN